MSAAKPPKKRNTSLAAAIADRLDLVNTPAWRIGTIKSVNTGASTCVVTILDADFVDVHFMTTYNPTVNDTVILLASGKQLLILGKIGPYQAPSGGGGGTVTSVEGRTGDVVVTAADLGLAAVATSGVYSDLSGKPTLATVATSGAYTDLTGKPSLAAVATSGSATDITSGTLPTAQVPNLDTSKLTSGTLGVARGGTGLVTVTAGNFLTGNGTGALNSRTPTQVKSDLGLATVASSGGYADLSGKPSIVTISGSGTQTVTSTTASITATQTSFTTTHANSVVIANAFFDVTNGTASAGKRFVGYVGLDGTAQTANAAVWGSDTASARATVGVTIRLVVASAGSHTLDLWCSANGTIPTLHAASFTAVIYDGF